MTRILRLIFVNAEVMAISCTALAAFTVPQVPFESPDLLGHVLHASDMK
jgi:hypothetical protein